MPTPPLLSYVPIARSLERTQQGLAPSYYLSDYDRYAAVWHVSNCTIDECDICNNFVDNGRVISCDCCSKIHHTDWLGWRGILDSNGRCFVYCGECYELNCGQLFFPFYEKMSEDV